MTVGKNLAWRLRQTDAALRGDLRVLDREMRLAAKHEKTAKRAGRDRRRKDFFYASQRLAHAIGSLQEARQSLLSARKFARWAGRSKP